VARDAGRGFLPRVRALFCVGAEGLRDPQGQRLPPCMVMDRGESLQDFLQRAHPDRFLSLWVRPCVLTCVISSLVATLSCTWSAEHWIMTRWLCSTEGHRLL
jgi:hypothetical protein